MVTQQGRTRGGVKPRGKQESSTQRAQGPPFLLVLQLAAGTEERDTGAAHCMSQIVAKKGQKLYLQALCCFQQTGFLPSMGKGRWCPVHEVWGACFGTQFPALSHQRIWRRWCLGGLPDPLLRDKALCVLQEGAPRWLVGNEVTSQRLQRAS